MKKKQRSQISSKEVINVNRKIIELLAKIDEIRNSCTHHYEVLSRCDGWDGYSRVSLDISEEVHCIICGHHTYRETGQVYNH